MNNNIYKHHIHIHTKSDTNYKTLCFSLFSDFFLLTTLLSTFLQVIAKVSLKIQGYESQNLIH